jgi:nucleotide-binding universal stress UspA family protein
VDGSFAAIRAARWAAAVAEKLAAPLQILHAKPALGHNPADSIASLVAADMTAQRESAEAILQSAEHAVRAHFRGLHITGTQVDGPADQALIESCRTARLIVLGTDELSIGTALLVGSTTMAVAAHSTCPVVAWRRDATTPTREPVVVGVDHENDSQVAITAAFEFANGLGLGIIAIHAWTTRRPAGDVTLPFMIDWDQVENEAQQYLSDVLRPWIKVYPDVVVSQIVDPDRPSRALLRCSQDAQLIVIGSRGRGLVASAYWDPQGLTCYTTQLSRS